MFSNQFNYNKIIYLEILDNTIKNHKKNVLNIMCNYLHNGIISYDDYYNIYNKNHFNLYKYYNQYYNMNYLFY